jgi:hypothetical protein
MDKNRLSAEVTAYLDHLNHPRREEIECLREIILKSIPELKENIKWNGPNYSHHGEDRITMRIHPAKQLQLIFHRGAKPRKQPEEKLLNGDYSFLIWKENDRAVATFKDMEEIRSYEKILSKITDEWIDRTSH